MTELGALAQPHSGFCQLGATVFAASSAPWAGPAPSAQLSGLCLLLPVLPGQGFDPGSSPLPAPPGTHDYCDRNGCTAGLPSQGSSFFQTPLELIWQVFHFGAQPALGSAQQARKNSYMKCPHPPNRLSSLLTSFLTPFSSCFYPLPTYLLLLKGLFALPPSGQDFYSILIRKPWYTNSSTSSSARIKLLHFTLG